MLSFTVIALTPASLVQAFGPAAHLYEQSVLNGMDKIVSDYEGGLYELRKFVNGAHALVLDEQTMHAITFSNNTASLSLEGASLLINCIVSAQLCEFFYEKNDAAQNQFFHDQHAALKDALNNRIGFVIDPLAPSGEGYRDPTSDELETLAANKSHPEASIIIRLLD